MGAAKSYKPLKVAQWPALDRAAWESANQTGDEFTESGIAAHWAERSRENAELAYGRYLGFLQRRDRLLSARRIGERLDEDCLCAFGRELSTQLAPYTVAGIFGSLGMAVKAMDPAADRRVINAIISRLTPRLKSVRDIERNLIPPAELEGLGLAMMGEAERSTHHSFRTASLYRDGLIVTFMSLCPLRPGAVCNIRLGRHLVCEGGRFSLRFPMLRRQKRRPPTVPLTPDLERRLHRYLQKFRPMFPAPRAENADALWLTRNGNPLNRDGLSKRIKERLGRRTGKRFSAHMFRHAAATYIVQVAPQRALMVVGVLGHSGLRTARRYYIKGQQHVAVFAFQKAVASIQLFGKGKKRRPRLGSPATGLQP